MCVMMNTKKLPFSLGEEEQFMVREAGIEPAPD